MQKAQAKNIIIIKDLLSPESYGNAYRLLEQLQSTKRLDQFLTDISPIKVLQFKQELYACENAAVIQILASFLPTHELTVWTKKVKTKQELINSLLCCNICLSINQLPAAKLPIWDHQFCDSQSIKPMFSKSKWATILNKHRTAVYERGKNSKKIAITSPENQRVDINAVLQAVPKLRKKS